MESTRPLTEEAAARIAHFYKPRFPFVLIFTLAFGIPLTVLAGLVMGNIAVWSMLLMMGGILFIYYRSVANRAERAAEIFQYGEYVDIQLETVAEDYNYRLNGAPQCILTISRGIQLFTIKTFSVKVINAFSPRRQKAYYYAKYPNIVIPSTLFSDEYYTGGNFRHQPVNMAH